MQRGLYLRVAAPGIVLKIMINTSLFIFNWLINPFHLLLPLTSHVGTGELAYVFPWLSDGPRGQYDTTEEREKVSYLCSSCLPQSSLQQGSANLNKVDMHDSYGKIFF